MTQKNHTPPSPTLPRLWLFTDADRLPDPRFAVSKLPRGRAGVVLRHDSDPRRTALGRDLARICRDRRLVLVVAGDVRLAAALRAGVHLRGGRRPGPYRRGPSRLGPYRPGPHQLGPHRSRGIVTSSAHSVAELRRAARLGANLVFLSPAFPTASHPGAPGLGPLRWGAMARHVPGLRLAALGGIDGTSIRRLPRHACHAAGAIGALAP